MHGSSWFRLKWTKFGFKRNHETTTVALLLNLKGTSPNLNEILLVLDKFVRERERERERERTRVRGMVVSGETTFGQVNFHRVSKPKTATRPTPLRF